MMDGMKEQKCWHCGATMTRTQPEDGFFKWHCTHCGKTAGPFVEDGKTLSVSHPKVLDALANAVETVVDYMYDEEKDFKERREPSENHIYRQVLTLKAWLERYRHNGVEVTDIDYFGGCPECHDCDASLNVHSTHWHVCHLHHVRWCIGSNLFSNWKNEDETTWDSNVALLNTCHEVESVNSVIHLAGYEAEQATNETSCFVCI